MEETFLNHLDWTKPNCTYLNWCKHQDFWSINSSWAWETSRIYRYLGRFIFLSWLQLLKSRVQYPSRQLWSDVLYAVTLQLQNPEVANIPFACTLDQRLDRWTHPKSGMMFECVKKITVKKYSSNLTRGQTCFRTLHEYTVKWSGLPKKGNFQAHHKFDCEGQGCSFRGHCGKSCRQTCFWTFLAPQKIMPSYFMQDTCQ